MSKHTPGPWEYLAEEEGMAGAITAKTGWICDFDTDPSPANARLIAAAPDLLEALKGMVQLDEEEHQRGPGDIDICKEVQDAYSAIAKATGEQCCTR